jgi:hypothetical protein
VRYAIEYEYPGTEGGQPVGRVFAVRLEDSIPGYPRNIGWSYVRDPREATLFPSASDAEAIASTKRWPKWKVEPVP